MNFDYSEGSEHMKLCLNWSVFDVDNGTMIKLGEDNEVLAAMKGLHVLTPQQLRQIYGSPVPKYSGLQWPNLWNFHSPPYFETFSTYFDTV